MLPLDKLADDREGGEGNARVMEGVLCDAGVVKVVLIMSGVVDEEVGVLDADFADDFAGVVVVGSAVLGVLRGKWSVLPCLAEADEREVLAGEMDVDLEAGC